MEFILKLTGKTSLLTLLVLDMPPCYSCHHFRCIFCGRSYAHRYVWEKPVCLFIDCKCFIWLDAKAQVESNYTEIIFIPEVINAKCAANSM